MERIDRISFVSLDGETPGELGLEPLPAGPDVAAILRVAFAPFGVSNELLEFVHGGMRPVPPETGLHVIYVFGHAWIGPTGPEAAVREGDGSRTVGGAELLHTLLDPDAADRTVLILDCCHAASFDPLIAALPRPPRLSVYACAAAEKAIAVHSDKASRLSLALAVGLAGNRAAIDMVAVVADSAARLAADGVLRGQSITYRMHGPAILLTKAGASPRTGRERAVARVRNILLASGATVAVALVVLGWLYWSRALIQLELGSLEQIASDIGITVSAEDPTKNESVLVTRARAAGTAVRLWVPAGNIIVRVAATYNDGEPRAIAFHQLLAPGFDLSPKLVLLSLPGVAEISARPGMAYVPATAWFHGRERQPRQNAAPYWIDIQPPTVAEYLPVARALVQSGNLERENSYLLNSEQAASAIENVGLGQLRSLSGDLGAILSVIEAANAPHVSAPGNIIVGTTKTPCAGCPAPMTRHEAGLFCTRQGKRLPTDLEWELAVRGADGRDFPWGSRLDQTRANIPGLPQQGGPAPALRPVEAYRDYPSPFGLIDTVGNAGDWVENESGAYERIYMGATYQFNPEDATAFRQLPVTETDALVREITARCVADAGFQGAAPNQSMPR